jgi:hypothetical protein
MYSSMQMTAPHIISRTFRFNVQTSKRMQHEMHTNLVTFRRTAPIIAHICRYQNSALYSSNWTNRKQADSMTKLSCQLLIGGLRKDTHECISQTSGTYLFFRIMHLPNMRNSHLHAQWRMTQHI